ncbi:hypothetical protein HMPREF9120_01833 [Neisseria sp. oral taxon 020 str. F0370]|nr:hypothetical protein HMPREF9120_01833 [Neisseria sp. oral taxon 020 str. F0370]
MRFNSVEVSLSETASPRRRGRSYPMDIEPHILRCVDCFGCAVPREKPLQNRRPSCHKAYLK